MGRYGLFDVLTIGGVWLFAALAVAVVLFGVPIPGAVFVVLALGIAVVAKVAGDGWQRFNDDRDAERTTRRDTSGASGTGSERVRLGAVDRAAAGWARGERDGGRS